jgi:hypothetical protein
MGTAASPQPGHSLLLHGNDYLFARYCKTKQYAYAIAFPQGLLVAYVGVRALSNFYEPLPALPPFQSEIRD